MTYINIIFFILSVTLSYIILPHIYNMLIKGNCLSLNYKKEKIPIGMGIGFVIIQSFVCFIASLILNYYQEIIFTYIIALILMGLVGLIDDLIGRNEIKGFRGHLSSLFKGELTTGGFKAIMGILISVMVSITFSRNIFDLFINIMVIALFTNIINLFDLRPGRAGKIFIIISVLFIITYQNDNFSIILFSSLGIILVYLPIDLKGRGMMGDIGSNSLGITLGIYISLVSNITTKISILVILFFLHVISEIYSFTDIINNNNILRKIDNLGRR